MNNLDNRLLITKNNSCVPLSEISVMNYDEFFKCIDIYLSDSGRIISYFGVLENNDVIALYALVAAKHIKDFFVIKTYVNERFQSLSDRHPQMSIFEREIAEQFGIIADGHPCFKPIRFHKSWRSHDAWGRDINVHPLVGDMEYYYLKGHDVHEVGVGPVHAGVIEPGHFRFQCHGEKVINLEISLGYQHRDIEKLLTNGPYGYSIHQIETVAGDTTIGHSTAYCNIVEAISDVKISKRANFIREILLELERIANHVGDIGALAGDIGYLPTNAFCGRLRGDYLNLSAELCGSRFGRGIVRPGGVLFDITDEIKNRITAKLNVIAEQTKGAIELFFDTPSVLARLEGVGKVKLSDAESLGLVGVAARACGLNIDSRFNFEQLNSIIGRSIVLDESGDVFGRANVRRGEIYSSINYINYLLENMPEGGIFTPKPCVRGSSLVVSVVEGWRGEIVHTALTDDNGRFLRYKIVDPSFHNWAGLCMALRSEEISDFPLCNKSFNLSYCGFDL